MLSIFKKVLIEIKYRCHWCFSSVQQTRKWEILLFQTLCLLEVMVTDPQKRFADRMLTKQLHPSEAV